MNDRVFSRSLTAHLAVRLIGAGPVASPFFMRCRFVAGPRFFRAYAKMPGLSEAKGQASPCGDAGAMFSQGVDPLADLQALGNRQSRNGLSALIADCDGPGRIVTINVS